MRISAKVSPFQVIFELDKMQSVIFTDEWQVFQPWQGVVRLARPVQYCRFGEDSAQRCCAFRRHDPSRVVGGYGSRCT